MGAEQRKHSAPAAGQSHISLTPSAQSTTGCHQPTKTVWMSFITLHTNWVVANFVQRLITTGFHIIMMVL